MRRCSSLEQVAPNSEGERNSRRAAIKGRMSARFWIVVALALLVASCRSMTPLEIALDERTKGQLFLLARDPGKTYAQLGTPDVVRPGGPWTYYEWRLSGRVYDRIRVVRADRDGSRSLEYRYVPAGSDTKLSGCRLRAWIKVEESTRHLHHRIGPDKSACLQLLDWRLATQASVE